MRAQRKSKSPTSRSATATRPLSPAGVKPLLRAQIALGADALRGDRAPSDAAVHNARKALKRARALLRLLRDAVALDSYRRENSALRGAARPLSQVRDAQVVREALARVSQDLADGSAAAAIDRLLRRRQREVRRAALTPENREQIISALEASSRRIARWTVAADRARLRSGAERIYRQGRKALAQVRLDAGSAEERLHEARKRVKYLELALEPFGCKGRDSCSAVVKSAEAIEERLGLDHDLAVLRKIVEPLRANGDGQARRIARSIANRQRGLRSKALQQARKLYRQKPRRFGRDIEASFAA